MHLVRTWRMHAYSMQHIVESYLLLKAAYHLSNVPLLSDDMLPVQQYGYNRGSLWCFVGMLILLCVPLHVLLWCTEYATRGWMSKTLRWGLYKLRSCGRHTCLSACTVLHNADVQTKRSTHMSASTIADSTTCDTHTQTSMCNTVLNYLFAAPEAVAVTMPCQRMQVPTSALVHSGKRDALYLSICDRCRLSVSYVSAHSP